MACRGRGRTGRHGSRGAATSGPAGRPGGSASPGGEDGAGEVGRAIAGSLALRRDHPVPLRRQLASGLAAAIRDGRVRSGARLPGTRSLAEALGVHRHTVAAAYRELRRAGLARTALGRGVYASRAAERPRQSRTVGAFVAEARGAGYSARGVARELGLARRALDSRRLLVVEPEAELRALLAAEVAHAVPGPLDTCAPRALERAPSRAGRRHVLARPALLVRLAGLLPPWIVPFPLRCGGGTRELRLARALAAGDVVAVITASPAVRRYARELLAVAAPGVGAATPRPGDAPGVERALRVARLVFADTCCVREPRLRDHRRVVTFRVLCPEGVRALRRWLAPDVVAPMRRASHDGDPTTDSTPGEEEA